MCMGSSYDEETLYACCSAHFSRSRCSPEVGAAGAWAFDSGAGGRAQPHCVAGGRRSGRIHNLGSQEQARGLVQIGNAISPVEQVIQNAADAEASASAAGRPKFMLVPFIGNTAQPT